MNATSGARAAARGIHDVEGEKAQHGAREHLAGSAVLLRGFLG